MYKLIEKVGRAGNRANRVAKKKEWDIRFGEGKWEIVYFHNEKIFSRDEALENFYDKSYYIFLKNNPLIVNELCSMAQTLYNPHAEATGGVDLQVPAVQKALKTLGLELKGTGRVAVGVYRPGDGTHYFPPISFKLNPYSVPLWCDKTINVESFWQNFKHLAQIV